MAVVTRNGRLQSWTPILQVKKRLALSTGEWKCIQDTFPVRLHFETCPLFNNQLGVGINYCCCFNMFSLISICASWNRCDIRWFIFKYFSTQWLAHVSSFADTVRFVKSKIQSAKHCSVNLLKFEMKSLNCFRSILWSAAAMVNPVAIWFGFLFLKKV